MEPVKSRPAAKRRTKDGAEEHVRYEQDPRGAWYPLVRIVVRVAVEAPVPVIVVRMRDADPTAPEWPRRTVGALVSKLAMDDGAVFRVTYSRAMVPPSKLSRTGDWIDTHVHVLRVQRADGQRGWGAWHNGRWEEGQWWAPGDVMVRCVSGAKDWERLALGASVESQVLTRVG